ncbi:hypothetical protein HOM50_01215 [bacterium]|jgi:hypothetical protein|nr:hypothetical protein [bacterium]
MKKLILFALLMSGVIGSLRASTAGTAQDGSTRTTAPRFHAHTCTNNCSQG